MTSYYTTSMNFQDDCLSPITPPPQLPSSENSLLIEYLRSRQPSDYSTPYLSRPMINYFYHNNITGSGRSSGGSNRTPLSSLENFELSPLAKVEEDVFLVDGVLVTSKLGSKSGGGYGVEKFWTYKTELCKAWEDSGHCRYGFKCQYAHGQEELRAVTSRARDMKKLEMIKPKSSQSSGSSSSSNVLSQDDTMIITPGTSSSILKLPTSLPSKDWSPMDDGITMSLPGSTNNPATREAVDEFMHNIIYGPAPQKKRLSAFRDICPES